MTSSMQSSSLISSINFRLIDSEQKDISSHDVSLFTCSLYLNVPINYVDNPYEYSINKILVPPDIVKRLITHGRCCAELNPSTS